MRLQIRVPASVANLGPGFDIFAAAVQLQNEITVSESASGEMQLDVAGEGAEELSNPHNNRLIDTYLQCCDEMRIPQAQRGLTVRCLNRIPLRRGLGSSAAAALAGVLMASAWHRLPWDEQEILQRVSAIEGHRDNAAAALMGGLVICSPGLPAVQMAMDERLQAVILVPERELATDSSRQVVAKNFSRSDAVFNASRCALLVRALALGDWDQLAVAMQDRWHQDARAQLLPGLADVIAAALEAGALGAALAGAGPSVVALVGGDGAAVAQEWQLRAAAMDWPARTLALPFRNFGARVQVSA